MRKLLFFVAVFVSTSHSIAQQSKVDSFEALLSKEKIETTRVRLLWELAELTKNSNTEKALAYARQSLFIAEKIKYEEGQSKALGKIANTFLNVGNYPQALEYYFKKLKLEEKRNNAKNLASVLMSIGTVYIYQEEYIKSLEYYYRSDSIIESQKIEDYKYYIFQNLGDVYDRLNLSDSSYMYFKKALSEAKQNDDLLGTSLTGLGHSYRKRGNFSLGITNYHSAISHLEKAHNNYFLCEATLGLASLYQQLNKYDSAEYYGRRSLTIAKNDKFLNRDLDAAKFLTALFKRLKKIDSAFSYLDYVQILNDSINSKNRIREFQVMSSNEQLRQIEIEENKKIAQQVRKQELQLLLIGIFIPVFFLLTFLLSRIRMDVRVVKILGIACLLFLFEYLTLLLHPYVTVLTHHTPVYELLVYVSIAAILIPIHHRVEHWLIDKLVHDERMLKLTMKTAKFKMKELPDTDRQ